MKWQPMDTAPKDGTDILLCINANTQVVAFWDEAGREVYHWQTPDGIAYHDEAPTHWMPLPPYPDEDQP